MWPSNFLPNWDSRPAKSLGALGLGAERSKKYAPLPSGAQVVALMTVAVCSRVTAEWPARAVLAKAAINPAASCRQAIHTPEPPHPRLNERTVKRKPVAGRSWLAACGRSCGTAAHHHSEWCHRRLAPERIPGGFIEYHGRFRLLGGRADADVVLGTRDGEIHGEPAIPGPD